MVKAHTAGINFYLGLLSEVGLPVEYGLAGRGVPEPWEDWHTYVEQMLPVFVYTCRRLIDLSRLIAGTLCIRCVTSSWAISI